MHVLGLSLGLRVMMVAAAFAYDDATTGLVSPPSATLEGFGRTLFHDVNLSANRTEASATCHDPEMAFADLRDMAPTGDVCISGGDRNAPTASYAALVPPLHRDEDGNWVGGHFRDGRATGIAEQAAGPPLAAGDPAQRGKFRTPTLRNVAVTAPYVSNGVFADLRAVVLCNNIYNTRSEARPINPETGAPFDPPPVAETRSMDGLTHGPALDDPRVAAIVALPKTRTNARYEHLLEGE